jgi:HEAT repeat protein
MVNTIALLGGVGMAQLGELLATSDRWPEVLSALPRFRIDALPLLPAMLHRLRQLGTGWDASQVICAIMALGAAATEAVPELLRVAEDPTSEDVNAQCSALEALAVLADGLEPFYPRLLALSRQPDLHYEMRARFPRVFARLSVRLPAALDVVREQLRAAAPADDRDAVWTKGPIRSSCALAMAEIGPAAAPALPELITLLGDPYDDAQRCAIQALGAIGDRSVLPHLCRLANVPGYHRSEVAQALGALGDSSDPVVGALASLAGDSNPYVRRQAIDALGKLQAKTKAALGVFHRARKDKDYGVRTRANAALKGVAEKQPKKAAGKRRTPKQAKQP